MHRVVVMHPERRLGNGGCLWRVQALAIRLERVDVLLPMQEPVAVYHGSYVRLTAGRRGCARRTGPG
jgi:hypothetical protein